MTLYKNIFMYGINVIMLNAKKSVQNRFLTACTDNLRFFVFESYYLQPVTNISVIPVEGF